MTPRTAPKTPTTADRLSYFTIRSAEVLGMRVPRAVGVPLAEMALRVVSRQANGQREIVARNLAHVLGHDPGSHLVQRATEECFALYGRYWYDTFALRSMSAEEVDERFSIEGLENVDRALEAGRGVIVCLPHMGNWDAAGHWFALHGYRMTAVAEQLNPVSVFDLFLRHRRALGMGIVPLSGGRKVAERLVGLLSRNELIALVADRNIEGRGVEVEMFGARRPLPAGPAFLSLATGAALCPAGVFTTDDGWHCVMEPPLEVERTGDMNKDVATLTRLVAERYERFIASAPTDWHMFQPAWE